MQVTVQIELHNESCVSFAMHISKASEQAMKNCIGWADGWTSLSPDYTLTNVYTQFKCWFPIFHLLLSQIIIISSLYQRPADFSPTPFNKDDTTSDDDSDDYKTDTTFIIK